MPLGLKVNAMNMTRVSTLFAAAAAMISMTAGSAQAQGLFGGYSQSYPVYSAPSTNVWPSQPCATGNCGVQGYTSNYRQTPCATGNCPTTPYTAAYPTATCPTGTCPPGQCVHGANSAQCQTICGPNGCQTICPTAGMQCGPNGCVPAVGYGNNVNYGATTSAVPSLNLDQVSSWNNNSYGNYGAPTVNMNRGFTGATNFGQVAPARNFTRPAFSGMNNGGYMPASAGTNISNDPMVRLN
jgi:hypothetical protein